MFLVGFNMFFADLSMLLSSVPIILARNKASGVLRRVLIAMPHRHLLRLRVDLELRDLEAVVEDAGGHEATWEDLLAVRSEA